MPRDYYEVLSLGRDAQAAEVKKAYRKLAKQFHPDVNKAPDAQARFSEVQEAYEVLTDPEKRRLYDQFGHAGVNRGAQSGGGPGHGQGTGRTYSGPDGFSYHVEGDGQNVNLDDIFSQFFGGGGAGGGFGRGARAGRRRGPAAPPAAGADITHEITVPFLTAAQGGNVRLQVADQTLDIKIPSAITDGAKLRLRGKGMPSPQGGGPGDLLLTVHVQPHTYFTRDGLDLLLEVPLTIDEAIFGASVRIPTLDGHATIKIPPGTGSGKKLRLKNAGLFDAKGQKGDLYVVVKVDVPGTLTDEQRMALEALRGKLPNPRTW